MVVVRGQAPSPSLLDQVLDELPPPRHLPKEASQLPTPTPLPTPKSKVVPINLDTILRLAEQQNVKINLAREKLNEANANKAVADKAWLPDISVGTSYYRHEGGIADFQGDLVHSSYGSFFAGLELKGTLDLAEAVYQRVDAERQIWQQRGELQRMTSESLLDAASTYVDLLAALSGEVVTRKAQENLEALLKQAEALAATEQGARVEVDRITGELAAQKLLLRRMHENVVAASARLAQLLGLDPLAQLIALDRRLVPFRLVDARRPAADLVAQAQTQGPGVREMEGLLALINDSLAKAQGPGRFMPILEIKAGEGIFGTGPGSSSQWDNRFDMCLGAWWNVTKMVTAKDRLHVAQTKLAQANLSYEELRGKLAVGVQEAREASLSNTEQMRWADDQIQASLKAYDLSKLRFQRNIKGATPGEVLLSVRALNGAELNKLGAVRELNKAQLRLMILLGGADGHCGPIH
jgi:outer membrane protein TolC